MWPKHASTVSIWNMTFQSKMNPIFRDLPDNFGPLLRWISLFWSIFDEVLKIWTQVQKFENCSDFSHIWCDEFFFWVVFTHQIWAKSEHFWQCPKFWTQFFWQYGKTPLQIFDMLLLVENQIHNFCFLYEKG